MTTIAPKAIVLIADEREKAPISIHAVPNARPISLSTEGFLSFDGFCDSDILSVYNEKKPQRVLCARSGERPDKVCVSKAMSCWIYQSEQRFAATIGDPALH
jgi:hypothetical protein